MPDPAAGYSRSRSGGFRVGVIGVGRAGTALANALARAGHGLVGVSAVSDASVERAARMLPGVPVKQPSVLVADSSLVLLTVQDDALNDVVTELAAIQVPLQGRVLVHASGRHGIGVLAPATRRGALPLALHPVMTFTGRADDADRMAGICFGVTAPEELRATAEALVLDMGGEPVFIEEADRGLYHAAIASGANHLVTLVAQAAELLAKVHVPNPGQMLRPILSAALDNVLQLGDAGLTGPVARGDADTVAGHLEALSVASPQALQAYIAMAQLTVERARAAGTLDPPDAQRLLTVLSGATG